MHHCGGCMYIPFNCHPIFYSSFIRVLILFPKSLFSRSRVSSRRKYVILRDSLTKIGNNVAILLGDERLGDVDTYLNVAKRRIRRQFYNNPTH